MKKKIAMALSLVMALAMTACGSTPAGNTESSNSSVEESTSKESSTPVEENKGEGGTEANLIFSWWGNQTRNERTQQVLDLYSEQNPGITFDAQFADWGDYWNKLATASAGHNLPDLVQMDYKYLKQYVDNGMLVDLTPYIESGVLDVSNVDEGILEAGSIDGGVYAICAGVNAPALIYNKTLLEENDITIKDNMTMDEFYDVCKEIYEKTGVKTNIAYGLGENYIDYTLRSQGVELYSQDGKALGVSSADELVGYFQIYENGLEEGWMVKPEVFAERSIGTVEQDPLVYGSTPDARSWCFLSYSNALSSVQSAADAEGFQIGVTTWPADDPKAANYLKPGMFFSVTVDSENPEEAAKVLNAITNSVECNQILLAERGIPASSDIADAIAGDLDDMQKMAVTYINEVVTPNCSAISAPAPEKSAEVLNLLDQLQEQVCYKQLTAEDAAAKLFEEGNKILAN
ncbi:extracellular solute-binding protein [Lachnospiraceae bacterium OttesenSCG-928-D06]|nr:extracellular solute-binding protein [Lachnospiraceae bacterium OttesenSCG-928-D06]